ncbi:unnamed protein product, partial [Phaeothamnion confervicola]
ERIYATKRRSFLPAEPARLIRAGEFSNPVVCLGEVHSNPLHHRLQFRVIKALHQACLVRNEPFSIGLEMAYRQHQAALDRFVNVHGNLAALKSETSWDRTWGWDFNNYSKIFQYARVHGIPLVGLNLPRELVALVSQKGLDGLPDKLKASRIRRRFAVMPEMDLTNVNHKNRFKEMMAPMERFHGKLPPEVMDRFYQSQTLWEEYMAESAAHHVAKVGGTTAVLAGVAHIAYRDGLPDRIARRIGVAPFTVVPDSVAWTTVDGSGLPDVETPPGPNVADWVSDGV